MRRGKRVCTVLFAAMLFAFCMALTVQAKTKTSGSCGQKLNWQYKASTKTLTISGQGNMKNYSPDKPAPFASLEIRKVVIKEGVTSVGSYAFEYQPLSSVTLPRNLKTVGDYAFHHAADVGGVKFSALSDKITSIGVRAFWGTGIISGSGFKLPSGLKKIADGAFGTSVNDTAFKGTIKIPDKVKYIGEGAFGGYQAMTLYIPDSVTYIGDSNKVKTIKGNKSLYVKQRAGDMGVGYSGKASGKAALIYLKGEISDYTNDELMALTLVNTRTAPLELKASTNSNGKLTYKSSAPKVLAVSSKGVLTVKGAGKATITITAAKTKKFDKAVRKIKLTVVPAPKGSWIDYKSLNYEILSVNKSRKTGTLKAAGILDDSGISTLTIPDTIKLGGFTYTVKEIGEWAFSGTEKIRKVSIKAKSLTKIGASAFRDDTQLKKVDIASAKLSSVGEDAFAMIDPEAAFTVPAGKLSAYKKLLSEKAGFSGEMTLAGK